MSGVSHLSIVSVDVGGTFTDVTAIDDNGHVHSAKVLSTPADYSQGIISGIEAACGAGPHPPHLVVHGTTVATNAVLSRVGLGRAALVTTAGFGDVLAIGRIKRPNLYDLDWDKPASVIPGELIFEIGERMGQDGAPIQPPAKEALAALAEQIREADVSAVAVSLLNAYANPAHEEAIVAFLRASGCARLVFAATDLSREIQEFERTSTASLNAVLLAPVRDYIDRVSGLLHQRNASGLLVMQSNGGLLPAEAAKERPVGLLESGPAAGVLGAAHLARGLGLDKVIAFDMGGTTAKACLIEDGKPREAPEYEVGGELNTANPLLRGGGYPVRLPCLELCEVGAGGGSIAWVDEAGVLRAGPQSAGADPGPACYGRGGELPTVADAQLVLGYLTGGALGGGAVRVHADLARAAIERHVASKLSVSVEQAASAIFAVANATMSRAIRAVSVERGRDPAEYALVAFGGSGPVHAAAIARDLGIRRVVVPKYAGVFSALAMTTADMRRDAVQSVRFRLDQIAPAELDGAFRRAESALADEFATMQVNRSDLRFRRSLDVRYRGQAGRIEITAPTSLATAEIRESFEAGHEQLFGHRSPDDLVEIVALRVGATMPSVTVDQRLVASSDAAPITQKAYFEGAGWCAARIFADRSILRGAEAGPLVIAEPNSTILVPPGFTATLGADGEILIDVPPPAASAADLSGLSLEIVRHRFEAIVDEMTAMIAQTARSIIAREGHDFSTALCTPQGEIVAQGMGVLMHLGAVPYAIKAVHDRFGNRLCPGDIVLLNDPYAGGSHLQDYILVAPIFADTDLLGFAFVLSHQSDVSGGVPGGFAAGARDLFQEGIIIPPVRVMRGGELDEDVWRIVTRNTRAPRDVAGDLRAEMAACNKAASELRKLAAKLGVAHLRESMAALIDYAEKLTRAGIARLPSGSWTATDYLDDDGTGKPVKLTVDLTIDGSTAHADFSRSAPQMPNPFNTNAGVLASTVFMGFRCVLDGRIPDNSGFMRCFSVTAEPGTVVSPRDPGATSARGLTGYRLADLMFKVLAQVAPDRVWAAGEGGLGVVTFAGRQNDTPFLLMDTLGGGSGGRPNKDAIEGIAPPISNVRNHSVEIIERDYPVRLREYGFVPGTGGAGRWRGSNAMVKEYELLADHALVFARNDRRHVRPWGLSGGEEGAASTIHLRRAGSDAWDVLPVASIQNCSKGDSLRMVTPGGGGFGPPEERAPADRTRDAAEIRLKQRRLSAATP